MVKLSGTRSRKIHLLIPALNSTYIFTTGVSRATDFVAAGTHLLYPQRLGSGQVTICSHMTVPPKPWEMDANARRRRVRSLVGLDVSGERCLSGSPDGATGLGRSPHKPLAWAGCSRVQQRPPSLADRAHADTSQGSPDQPQASTTSSEIAAAERLWWSSVIKSRRAKLTLRPRVDTPQRNTLSKDCHPATVTSKTHGKLFRLETLPRCLLIVAWRGTSATRSLFTTSQKRDRKRSSPGEATHGPSHPKVTSESHRTKGHRPNPRDLWP